MKGFVFMVPNDIYDEREIVKGITATIDEIIKESPFRHINDNEHTQKLGNIKEVTIRQRAIMQEQTQRLPKLSSVG